MNERTNECCVSARDSRLEESARCRTEVARLAREVLTEHEAAAEKETGELEGSAATAVKVATLRMRATKRTAAAMAQAAAAEAAGSKNPRPTAKPSKSQTTTEEAPPALTLETDPFMIDEPYVPECGVTGGGEEYEEYVPMAPPEEGVDVEGGADEMQALLAQAADNPEVLAEVLAGLPEDQRGNLEAQLVAAGITPPSIP